MPKTGDGAQAEYQHVFSHRFDDPYRRILAACLVLDHCQTGEMAMLAMWI